MCSKHVRVIFLDGRDECMTVSINTNTQIRLYVGEV